MVGAGGIAFNRIPENGKLPINVHVRQGPRAWRSHLPHHAAITAKAMSAIGTDLLLRKQPQVLLG